MLADDNNSGAGMPPMVKCSPPIVQAAGFVGRDHVLTLICSQVTDRSLFVLNAPSPTSSEKNRRPRASFRSALPASGVRVALTRRFHVSLDPETKLSRAIDPVPVPGERHDRLRGREMIPGRQAGANILGWMTRVGGSESTIRRVEAFASSRLVAGRQKCGSILAPEPRLFPSTVCAAVAASATLGGFSTSKNRADSSDRNVSRPRLGSASHLTRRRGLPTTDPPSNRNSDLITAFMICFQRPQ
jgi:hypothetical protein